MLRPPGWKHTETISNTEPYIRLQLDRGPNAWMYWVRPAIAHHLKYGMVNPMLSEILICDMNELTYCRIEMSHNKAQCSTSILSTGLELDADFTGHSISLTQVLHYLLSCNKCKAISVKNWDTESVQPYLVYISLTKK